MAALKRIWLFVAGPLRWLFSATAILMKKDADYFDGFEPDLIFIAKRLPDAKELEALLSSAGIDYAVEADEYQGGIVFKTARVGAFFYVRSEVRERAEDVMLANGYIPVK